MGIYILYILACFLTCANLPAPSWDESHMHCRIVNLKFPVSLDFDFDNLTTLDVRLDRVVVFSLVAHRT